MSAMSTDVSRLTSATLAALPKAPNRYNPRRYPDRAIMRRNTVIELMRRHGVIDNLISIRVELPGVTAEQITIGITNDKLRIWGEKKRRPRRRRIISYLCSERSFGKFGRIVPLRWTVCIRTATAELANGMLYIRLPKIEDRRGEEVLVAVKEASTE